MPDPGGLDSPKQQQGNTISTCSFGCAAVWLLLLCHVSPVCLFRLYSACYYYYCCVCAVSATGVMRCMHVSAVHLACCLYLGGCFSCLGLLCFFSSVLRLLLLHRVSTRVPYSVHGSCMSVYVPSAILCTLCA